MAERFTAHICAYLIIEKDDTVLLSLRQGTGYADGEWNLPAGHTEKGETITQATCREALEEIGIQIKPENLETVHVMYRQSNRTNVDVFMRCSQWDGEITNCEPGKCGGLKFFPKNALPAETSAYIKQLFSLVKSGKIYSEIGW
ncbi:TPA: NUDIX hydrolase [Candidatus Dependentiae bacterium]|nr:MAG: NUDIX hydrolase [candidate division TM6 bacterium GW2011_GWF2_43_87]HBL98207.1 NUDIX hydrolase [Candidatus Dependentiae bacterium]